MIRSGALRHEVQYQTRSVTTDGLGQEVETWTTQRTWRASVRSAKGYERVAAAAQVRGDLYLVAEVRWPGFLPAAQARLLWGSRVLSVLWANDVNARRRAVELHCTEVTTLAAADASNL